jgi:membrane protein DedA with SNARE-associated domain
MIPEEKEPESRAATRRRRERTRGLIWVGVIAAIIIIGRFSPIKPVRDFFESFGWLTEQALRIAEDILESYGYLVVFLAPLTENTLFIGALIPGTLIMILAGLAIHDGLIDFWPAIILGIIGAMIGDTISYGMGRFGWRWLGPESRLVRWAERMREPLLEHSIWLVLSYHFAGYSRLIGPAASGFIRMPFLRWMLLDYIGVTIWVIVFIMGGYLLGVAGLSLEDSDQNVRVFEIILFVLFLIAVITILNRAGSRRRQRSDVSQGTDQDAPSPVGQSPTTAPLSDQAESPSEEETRERVR